MNFLKDRRRAGVLALLGTLIGAAALMFGVGGAEADTCGTTNGTPGDATVHLPGVVAADFNQEIILGTTSDPQFWLCVIPPNQGVGAAVHDANPATPGYQVESSTSGSLGGRYIEDDTGAEVNPTTSANPPASGAAGTGGSAGVGGGTCAYANGGTPTCPLGGFTVAGVTVNESDASVPTTHPNAGGCVTVPGNPCVTTAPDGFGVGVLKGDATRDTVTVNVLGTPQSKDLGGCVGFNAGAGC